MRGFYDGLTRFLDHVVEQGFLKPAQRANLLVSTDAADLLAQFARHAPPPAPRLIADDER